MSNDTATPTVPGCAPQVPTSERVMNSTVNASNSWAAAMAQVKPQAGLDNPHNTPERKPA